MVRVFVYTVLFKLHFCVTIGSQKFVNTLGHFFRGEAILRDHRCSNFNLNAIAFSPHLLSFSYQPPPPTNPTPRTIHRPRARTAALKFGNIHHVNKLIKIYISLETSQSNISVRETYDNMVSKLRMRSV